MIPKPLKVLCLAPVVLGCALASPVRPAATSESPFWFPGWGKPEMVVSEVPEGEQFRISHRGSTGFTPVSAVRRSAQARATQFCEDKGRAMTAISEQTSSQPQILGNFPRYEIVFVCTKKLSGADPSAPAEDPYERLKRLKELLDTGVISQEEFDREKREVLER
jgi:hypothetical protein